jgi:hypothetical protein
MRYADRDPPLTYADFAQVRHRWHSLGWSEVPSADEAGIQALWVQHLQPAGVRNVVVPNPSLSWSRLPRLTEAIEAEFTLKVLAAFRQCARRAERLVAIDWQHVWYYFDPRGGIKRATRDEWAVPVLPDGDAYHYLAQDYRFGVVTGWRCGGAVTLFGEALLSAFSVDPPKRFIATCGPGKPSDA